MSQPLLPIELLERHLRDRFETASITLDRPLNPTGVWFLDVVLVDHRVEIQWRTEQGFGISSTAFSQAYGEGVDELYPDEEAAYGRVVSLLLSGAFTSSPEPIRLRELRKGQGLSQAELAALLHKQQGEISKIERRSDVLLSTLREYVQSIGAELRIVVRLPDGLERALEIGDLPSQAAKPTSAPPNDNSIHGHKA